MAFVPFMVVGDMAAIAIPVAFKVTLSVVMRFHPMGAGVHRTGPVSFVPLIAGAHRIPVAPYPRIAGAGTLRLYPYYTGRRRRADSYSGGNLSQDGSRRPHPPDNHCSFPDSVL